jgi:site-specific DNA-methyltransferase (adenine-specific)/site-specific DNA-methyltransferase (cytosine-N4-specific)
MDIIQQEIKKNSLFLAEHNVTTKIILGDCSNVLKTIKDNSIDLIVTSPPYSDQRKNTYGGIKADQYVE